MGTVMSLPIEQHKELLKLSVLLKTAIDEKDWPGGDLIQHDVNCLKELIAGMNNDIGSNRFGLVEDL